MPARRPIVRLLLTTTLAGTLLAPVGCGGGETPTAPDAEGTPPADGGPNAAPADAPAGPAIGPDPDALLEMQDATRTFVDELLRAPLGAGTVGDLGMSGDFVERAALRSLQERYQDGQHRVTADRVIEPHPGDGGAPEPTGVFSARIEPHTVAPETLAARAPAAAGRPGNRAFRAGVIDGFTAPESPWPTEVSMTGPSGVAARLIARRLADDGVAATAVRALAILIPELPPEDPAAAALAALRDAGHPADLLGYVAPFASDGPRPATIHPYDAARTWTTQVLDRLGPAPRPAEVSALADEVAARPVEIPASRPGFRASRDDGVAPIGMIRLQATRGTYWEQRGRGGSLDVAASVLGALPNATAVLAIGRPYVNDALARLQAERSGGTGAPVVVVDELHVVTQWAQDNGQPGRIAGDPAPLLLAPRYASRGDLGSILEVGDSWTVDGLEAADIGVIRSPLLFQGGNVLVVGDPASADGTGRLMLLGDAEIERNRGLGLRDDEIVAAFRREFGVDRVVVCTPPAFHVDFATTIRRAGDRSIAFVHDEDAAFDAILADGVRRIAASGLMPPERASAAEIALERGDDRILIDAVGPVLYGRRLPDGSWPLTLADLFSDGGTTASVAAFDQFLVSFQRLVARTVDPTRIPGSSAERLYLASLADRSIAVAEFEDELRTLGFEIVRIPGFAMQKRSASAVNMVHGRDTLLRPVVGGALSELESAALATIREAVGGTVRIVDIPVAETQRRSGAVACAVAAWPAE